MTMAMQIKHKELQTAKIGTASGGTQCFRLILNVSQSVRTCETVLRDAGFEVTRFGDETLLCCRRAVGYQRLFGLKLTFAEISSDLTELTFSEVDTGLGALHCDLYKRRLVALRKMIEQKSA